MWARGTQFEASFRLTRGSIGINVDLPTRDINFCVAFGSFLRYLFCTHDLNSDPLLFDISFNSPSVHTVIHSKYFG